MKVVDVRADDFVRTKNLGCIDNQIFLPMVLRRARFSFDALSWKVPFSVGIANPMELVERTSLRHSC